MELPFELLECNIVLELEESSGNRCEIKVLQQIRHVLILLDHSLHSLLDTRHHLRGQCDAELRRKGPKESIIL